MKLATITALVASLGLASAAPGLAPAKAVGVLHMLSKKWNYDVCNNNCALSGVAMPDVNTFQLPLENNYSQQCPPISISLPDRSTVTSQVCLDFVGTNLYFNFSSFPGYTTKAASVAWGLKGNVDDPSSWSSGPPSTNLPCTQGASGFVCVLPFASILGLTGSVATTDLLAGMCPNGAREALDLFLSFSGSAQATGSSTTVDFNSLPPCTTRDASGTCTASSTTQNYFEMSYRCSSCEAAPCASSSSSSTSTSTTSSTSTSVSTTTSTSTSSTASSSPSPKPCGFGTAFGYQNPYGNCKKSYTLNTQSGQGCNRWGWYETPSSQDLRSGIGGPLYVGAGGNDISKAIDVGTWSAKLNSQGRVVVTYALDAGYSLSEAHVDVECLPIDKCAPGQYTYNSGAIANLRTWTTSPIPYPPSCSGNNKVALIVHAAVNKLTSANTCPAPKCT
ncbi:uncharacterized protein B0I36DRAFT_333240 [Microdochium trichocladiopsis]|uniref:Uncharacterized protein n=1 Tax=Microdochium trichocladiopsis TaxID=1682393 RepID=A0A9P9BHS0_9PEZI|nr:uncharacterized protein B0I36DRAFT_333240 [Microdochium trichocladiopsis]KAH7020830.1 hypothetical protein B0I36DRAFT_333240 [Microdochium trichocladiopsis]